MAKHVITVSAKDLPVAPRKLRLVIDVVRGKSLPEALVVLRFMNKKAAGYAIKVLKQAVAAANEERLTIETLRISNIQADKGQSFKRRMIGSRGRSSLIVKQRSHLKISVAPMAAPVKRQSRRVSEGGLEYPVKPVRVAPAVKHEAEIAPESVESAVEDTEVTDETIAVETTAEKTTSGVEREEDDHAEE